MTSCVAPKKYHTCVITCRVWCKNLHVPLLTSISENECEYILPWVEYYLGPSDGSMHCTQQVFYVCGNMQSLLQKPTCATFHEYEWEWVWVRTVLSWILSGPLRWHHTLHPKSVPHVWYHAGFGAKTYLCHFSQVWVRMSVSTHSSELSTIWAHQVAACTPLKKCHTCVITCRVQCKKLPVPLLTSMSENEYACMLPWVVNYY